MKRKFVKTDYNQVILREGDKTIHLDAEALAELYWEVKDGKMARVKHGHNAGGRYFTCSECGYVVNDLFEGSTSKVYLFEDGKDWNYCPNCGAKIDRIGETYEVKDGVRIRI